MTQASEAIIWGAQSWTEYAGATPARQELATAVGVMVLSSDLTGNSSTTFTEACQTPASTSYACTAVLKTYANDLCADDPYVGKYAQQNIVNGACTAFMIRPDTFATAAHCIQPDGVGDARIQCSNRSVVMHWRTATPSYPQGNPNILSQHIYRCTSVIRGPEDPSTVGDPGDWAIFTVDRPVTGGGATGGPLTTEREPLAISPEPLVAPSSGNIVIGYPNGMPLKVDPEVNIALAPAPNRPAGTFAIEADIEEGISGGPVLDSNGLVVGIVSGALGLVRDATRGCYNECFPASDNTPPTCTSLFGQYRPIAVSASQLPSSYRATSEHVVILLDQTGTMTKAGTSEGLTRWDDAVNAAIQWVQFDKLSAPFVERAYSIWTFKNDTVIGGTQNGAVKIWPTSGSTDCGSLEVDTGFCILPRAASLEPPEYSAVQSRLESIRTTHRPVTGPNTPLAGSLCSTLENLRSIEGLKRVIVESDGEENATPLTDPCGGTPSDAFGDWNTDLSLRALADWGMTLDSWQAKVVRRATRLAQPIAAAVASPLTINDWFPTDVVWQVDLHYGVSTPSPLAAFSIAAASESTEVAETLETLEEPAVIAAKTDASANSIAAVSLTTAVATPTLPPGELALFNNLGTANLRSRITGYSSAETGYGVDHAVAGDVDNDGCVGSTDLCLMMQGDVWSHRAVSPNETAVLADLTRDGWVESNDLDLVFENWSNGCGSVQVAPNRNAAIAACHAEYARRWLSFEDPSRPWTLGVGSVELSITNEVASNMQRSLVIDGCNYALLNSPVFSTRELPTGTRIALDVLLPTEQSNPSWLGDVGAHVSIPSAGLQNAWIGGYPLTGLTTGVWQTIIIELPSDIRSALGEEHNDAQLHIAFNTNNCLAPARIDNVRILQ